MQSQDLPSFVVVVKFRDTMTAAELFGDRAATGEHRGQLTYTVGDIRGVLFNHRIVVLAATDAGLQAAIDRYLCTSELEKLAAEGDEELKLEAKKTLEYIAH